MVSETFQGSQEASQGFSEVFKGTSGVPEGFRGALGGLMGISGRFGRSPGIAEALEAQGTSERFQGIAGKIHRIPGSLQGVSRASHEISEGFKGLEEKNLKSDGTAF